MALHDWSFWLDPLDETNRFLPRLLGILFLRSPCIPCCAVDRSPDPGQFPVMGLSLLLGLSCDSNHVSHYLRAQCKKSAVNTKSLGFAGHSIIDAACFVRLSWALSPIKRGSIQKAFVFDFP